ncbi:MAG: sensor histidine kinase [bacterium]
MRLLIKISFALFLVIITLLAIDGYVSFQHEIRMFDADMKHDALLVGHLMSGLISEVWKYGGQKRAFELIKEANRAENPIKIRWIWLDVPSATLDGFRMPHAMLSKLRRGQEISFKKITSDGAGYTYTYIPVMLESQRPGALELTESLSSLRIYTHKAIVRMIILFGTLLLAGGIMVWFFGTRFIGRPIKQLIAKTHRIGLGDLSIDPALHGHEELSDLMVSINQMCEHLTAAQEEVRIENEKRIAAVEQLRHTERLATLGRISSGIAHELGTPLNVVAGRAKLLATEEMDKDEIIECAVIIGEQAQRMTKIIRQLLDYARRGKAHRSLINIHNLIRHVLDLLSPIARKTNITLDFIENTDIPMIAIDQFQMQQVLLNLIMNGIQAMPDGGRLELSLRRERMHPPPGNNGENEYLAIYVKDEGEGIPKENLEHVFDAFFTTKKAGEGSGLGLSIAYGIVEDHMGWIRVESESKKGSCFTIYLPMEAQV